MRKSLVFIGVFLLGVSVGLGKFANAQKFIPESDLIFYDECMIQFTDIGIDLYSQDEIENLDDVKKKRIKKILSEFSKSKLRQIYKKHSSQLDRKQVALVIKSFPEDLSQRCQIMELFWTEKFSIAKIINGGIQEDEVKILKDTQIKNQKLLKPFYLWTETFSKLEEGLEELLILNPDSEKIVTRMQEIYQKCITISVPMTAENIKKLEKIRKCLNEVEGEFNEIAALKNKEKTDSDIFKISQYTLRNYYEDVNGIKKERERKNENCERKSRKSCSFHE